MHLDWMTEVERWLHWAVETHGGAVLSAGIWGFCFFIGATTAAGVVINWQRVRRLWWARSLDTATTTASMDVEIADVDPHLTTISLPMTRPPPLPGRLLN